MARLAQIGTTRKRSVEKVVTLGKKGGTYQNRHKSRYLFQLSLSLLLLSGFVTEKR